jgi:hypothetical protein
MADWPHFCGAETTQFLGQWKRQVPHSTFKGLPPLTGRPPTRNYLLVLLPPSNSAKLVTTWTFGGTSSPNSSTGGVPKEGGPPTPTSLSLGMLQAKMLHP